MILLTEEQYRNRIKEVKEIVYCIDPIEASRVYWRKYKQTLSGKQATKGYFEANIEIPSTCGVDRWITIKFSDYEKKETGDNYRFIGKFSFEFGFDMFSLIKKIEDAMWKYVKKLDKELETNELFKDILYESGVLKANYIVNFDFHFTVWTSEDKNLILDHAIIPERKSGVFDYGDTEFGREDVPQWDNHWEELINEYTMEHIDTLLERTVDMVEEEYSGAGEEVIGEKAVELLNLILDNVYTSRLFCWAVGDHLFYYTYHWAMEFLIDPLKRRNEKEKGSALGVEWLWSDTKP